MTTELPKIHAARVRLARTDALAPDELAGVRSLVFAAFGGERDEPFDEHDWQHALGGTHVIAELAGRVVAHASVVPRDLHAAGRPMRTGYVEAVGVDPTLQGRGLGTIIMRAANRHISDEYELGALGTGDQSFYERLGWRVWRGPTSIRSPRGDVPTPEEDGSIMVLLVASTPESLDVRAPLSCEWREGDGW